MTTPTTTARIRSIEPLEVFALRLGCDHGTMREVDLADEFWGPVFEPVRNDPQLFPQAHADRELGTIVWSNRADLGPDVLHGDLPSAALRAQSRLESRAHENAKRGDSRLPARRENVVITRKTA